MKNQRSRFRLITLLLLCGFLAAVVYGAIQTGVVPALLPENTETAETAEPTEPPASEPPAGLFGPLHPADGEAGNQPVSEESLNQSVTAPGGEAPAPAPSDDPLFNTTGL